MQNVIDLSRYLYSRTNLDIKAIESDLTAIVATISQASVEIVLLLNLEKFTPTRRTNSPIEIKSAVGLAGRAQSLIVDKIQNLGVKEVVCAGHIEASRRRADGHYVVAFDALDGASNIDTNMSLGKAP